LFAPITGYARVESEDLWTKANTQLLSGDAEGAATEFTALLGEYPDSGAVHYNLGIAYFRQKALGRSLYHFRQATLLMPRDADARFNLGFVRNQAADKIEAKEGMIARFFEEHLPISQAELWYAAALTAALLFITSAVLQWWRHAVVRIIQRTLGIFAFLLVSLGTLASVTSRPFGVITSAAANVMSGSGKDNVLLFTLHDGAEVIIDERRDEWVRIRLADGKKGWVRAADIVISR
jgi:tetratricopeptide (TPR) repeat protein